MLVPVPAPTAAVNAGAAGGGGGGGGKYRGPLVLDLDLTHTSNNGVILYRTHTGANQKWKFVSSDPTGRLGVIQNGLEGWNLSADMKTMHCVGSKHCNLWGVYDAAGAKIRAGLIDSNKTATAGSGGGGSGGGGGGGGDGIKASALRDAAAGLQKVQPNTKTAEPAAKTGGGSGGSIAGSGGASATGTKWPDKPPQTFIFLPETFDAKQQRWVAAEKVNPTTLGSYAASDEPFVNREYALAANTAAGHEHHPQLTFITYNIWFSLWRRQQRMTELLRLWSTLKPDVICLQEVVPDTLAFILEQPWIRAQYCVSDSSGRTVQPYGVTILTKLTVHHFSFTKFEGTKMARMLLVGHSHIGGEPIAIGTAHFESMSKW